MITIVVFINFLLRILANVTSVDLSKCKVTHKGTEYVGKLSRTETNVPCQEWSVTNKGLELKNATFPDGSKLLAKNYCRNPNGNPRGPWCYTAEKKLIFDMCDVPLCKTLECRITGTGMEYAGLIEKSVSGRKCTKWKGRHNLRDKRNAFSLSNNFFADGSIDEAGRKCRNPDGNVAGPWCFVERDFNNFHVRELCDVPFCDDVGSLMYSEGSVSGRYFFFSSINESQSLNVGFRLWNPADWLHGELYLFLSAYDIGSNRKDIERWNSGVEIKISHKGSGILVKKDDNLQETPLILSGAKWTDLKIVWFNDGDQRLVVQVYRKPMEKYFSSRIISIPNTIFEIRSFRYFSLGGSPALWNLHSGDVGCSVHTVTVLNFTRFWQIKKTFLGKDIDVFVRANKIAVISMKMAPMNESGRVEISFGNGDKISVCTYTNRYQCRQLAEKSWANALSFWKWEWFKITLFKEKLQLFWLHDTATSLLLEASHENIEKVMWVSFASPLTSYWTLYCDPRGISDPPPLSPPECVSRKGDNFKGTLSVTESGRQCIPWTDKSSLPEKYQNDSLFQSYGGRVSCQNFCRNLDYDSAGAYCIIKSSRSESGFGLEYCNPRSCSSGDCKLAGTGKDYIGQMNTTRSKRECKNWTEVEDDLIDIKNFPDSTLQDAGNFCRNPNKSVSGSWCFTTDEKVLTDSCFIKDCDKPLECTILLAGYEKGTYIYILPKWRTSGLKFWVKAWNPDIYEGLRITLYSLNRSEKYTLLIGARYNEKLLLYYRSGLSKILTAYKTLSHLISAGKWRGFWLRTSKGKIELGYEGVSKPFFEWTSLKSELTFEPMFLNFGTLHKKWIAINFDCGECITTESTVQFAHYIYPINLWHVDSDPSNLLLNLRGKGSAVVTLVWTPDFESNLAVEIMSNSPIVSIIKYSGNKSVRLASFSVNSALPEDCWSEYIFSFTENSLTLYKDKVHLFDWTSPFPLFIYWFTVTAGRGAVLWTANCPPSDLEGNPRNGNWGKWGPWKCSVTCGKGRGRLERKCDNPPPNIYGRECKGPSVYEGPCNDFPCGKISPDTNNLIRHHLSTQHKSLQVDASERVILKCNSRAISLICAEVSEVNITWTHNGFPYSRTKFHMDENYSLVIPHAQEKHNGVYLCIAYQEPNSLPSKVVLEVISLVVIKPKPTKKIRKGKGLNLKCNGLALSYVYADLSQRWELNGSLWRDYGLGSLQAFTTEKIENVTDSHAGIWTCVIIQEDFKFKWTTNWIYLKVKSAPSFWSHVTEDLAMAPLFGKLRSERTVAILIFSLIGSVTCLIILATIMLLRWLKS